MRVTGVWIFNKLHNPPTCLTLRPSYLINRRWRKMVYWWDVIIGLKYNIHSGIRLIHTPIGTKIKLVGFPHHGGFTTAFQWEMTPLLWMSYKTNHRPNRELMELAQPVPRSNKLQRRCSPEQQSMRARIHGKMLQLTTNDKAKSREFAILQFQWRS